MIKKTLSTFMAFLCIFSAGAPVFADGDEYLPIQYCKKHQIPTKRSVSAILSKKRKIVQKAFLAGLLIATGTNVEIAFRKKNSTPDFSVQKINGINVGVSNSTAKQNNEITAILNALQNKNFKFEFSNNRKYLTILSAKINGYFLNQNTIYKMGKKILELVLDNKPGEAPHILVNLNDDIELKHKILNIFNGLFEHNPTKSETTLKFFELPSDSKETEPVTNPVLVNYLKQHSDASSHLIVCYQKMFFAGLLSALGAEVIAMKKMPFKREFPECVEIHKVAKYPSKFTGERYRFLENVVKHINYIFLPEKLKIESLPLSYFTPIKVTIDDQIVLSESDIFNLGQKFYNLIYKILSDPVVHHQVIKPFQLINLNELPLFTQGVKEIFKDYTGKDLPDLK